MVSLADSLPTNRQWNTLIYPSEFTSAKNVSYIRKNFKDNSADHSPALFDAIKNQRFRQALLLIEGGIDVNVRNETGETPLIYTSKALNRKEHRKMRQKFAKMLLELGGNPNLQDYRGSTPLMHASIRGQDDLVQLLLTNNNTDITIQDKDGNTALMHASRLGYVPVIQAFVNNFLKRELDANLLRQKNNLGKNALQIAKEEEKIECVRLLTNFLTQYNNEYAQDVVKRNHLCNSLAKAKSLDSIANEEEMRRTGNGSKITSNYRDSHSDGFESALRRKIQDFKSSSMGNNERPGYFEEIWQQETMSWFSDDNSNYGLTKINKKIDHHPVKLPPIESNRLIDYKTWCEMGNIKQSKNRDNFSKI